MLGNYYYNLGDITDISISVKILLPIAWVPVRLPMDGWDTHAFSEEYFILIKSKI